MHPSPSERTAGVAAVPPAGETVPVFAVKRSHDSTTSQIQIAQKLHFFFMFHIYKDDKEAYKQVIEDQLLFVGAVTTRMGPRCSSPLRSTTRLRVEPLPPLGAHSWPCYISSSTPPPSSGFRRTPPCWFCLQKPGTEADTWVHKNIIGLNIKKTKEVTNDFRKKPYVHSALHIHGGGWRGCPASNSWAHFRGPLMDDKRHIKKAWKWL